MRQINICQDKCLLAFYGKNGRGGGDLLKIVVLDDQTESVRCLANKDKRLAKVIKMVEPITYKIYEDLYQFLVHGIIEQMQSVKAAAKIHGRFEEICNGEVFPEVVHTLTIEQIREIGTSIAKAKYIHAVTDVLLEDSIRFSDLESMSDDGESSKNSQRFRESVFGLQKCI